MEFRACKFEGVSNGNDYIQFLSFHRNSLRFVNNVFERVDLYLGFRSEHEANLVLQGNKFNNNHVSVGADKRATHRQGLWAYSSRKPEAARNMQGMVNRKFVEAYEVARGSLDDDDSTDLKLKRDFFNYVLQRDARLEISPEEMIENDSRTDVVFGHNDFNALILGSPVNYTLNGGNKIKRFILHDFSRLQFSSRQEIGNSGVYAMEHRETFLRLRKYASDKSDIYQERIFKREILKCESQLLHGQRWRDTWQDKLILWWGRLISDHGVSWWPPVLFLFMVNFLVAFYIVYMKIYDQNIGIGGIFWLLLNPTFNFLPELSEREFVNGLACFVFIIQKIVLAACAYEFIKSVRRFS